MQLLISVWTVSGPWLEVHLWHPVHFFDVLIMHFLLVFVWYTLPITSLVRWAQDPEAGIVHRKCHALPIPVEAEQSVLVLVVIENVDNLLADCIPIHIFAPFLKVVIRHAGAWLVACDSTRFWVMRLNKIQSEQPFHEPINDSKCGRCLPC